MSYNIFGKIIPENRITFYMVGRLTTKTIKKWRADRYG